MVQQDQPDVSAPTNTEAGLDIDIDEYDVSIEATGRNDGQAYEVSSVQLSFPSQDSFHFQNMTVGLNQWNATPALLDEYNLTTSVCHRPTQLDIHVLIQFPFLDKFTKNTGFVASFECGTKERRLSVTDEPVVRKATHPPLSFAVETSDICWEEITRDALMLYEDQDAEILSLLPTTHAIVSQIRNVTLTKPRHSPIDLNWSVSSEALCYEFFHPKALQRHFALFWSCWYPNWPTIHRPTFDATKASPALVAAMALLGACLSPDDRVQATAQIWLNAVEEVVFSNDSIHDHNLSRVWQMRENKAARQAHLEILQAAYCVCLYQTWEGCQRSKRRILRRRFNDVVYVSIRGLSIVPR
jgi:hypothetical protein